ncbi:uncharacterized protein LOC125314342 [Rhodamnia argentea]|uniref:Uncharacterized protein LOC125314342 n=1 Tax=Rhodamnia argentea TaxID=178133 RepID=A0ABM3H6V7_9MYRT|nr:uncharacterized protein LOC125314342 [Rhodamnia argentea]
MEDRHLPAEATSRRSSSSRNKVPSKPTATETHQQRQPTTPPTEAMETGDVASGKRFFPEVLGFMQLAIDQLALDSLEVQVDCVIVEEGHLIAARRNRTNETQNARRRAEMEAH